MHEADTGEKRTPNGEGGGVKGTVYVVMCVRDCVYMCDVCDVCVDAKGHEEEKRKESDRET